MNKKKYDKYLSIIAIISFAIGILLLIALFVLLIAKIFYPAYLSVAGVCFDLSEEELAERGYFVAGETLLNVTEEGEEEVTITFAVGSDITLRHEICHYKQITKNKLYGCFQPFLKYINEVACYTKQYLPLYEEEMELIKSQAREE